jgi:hypothetical protein
MSGTARKSLNVYAGCRLVIIAILCSTEFLDFHVHLHTLEVIMVDEYPEVAVWVVGLRTVAASAQMGEVVSVVAALVAVGQDGVGEQAFHYLKLINTESS